VYEQGNGTTICFLGCGCVGTIKISGRKVLVHGRCRTNNRVTNALRMAARTLTTRHYVYGMRQFRRIRTRLGAPIAIKAMAASVARLVYRMLATGCTSVAKERSFYRGHHHRKLQYQLCSSGKPEPGGSQLVDALPALKAGVSGELCKGHWESGD